MLALVDGGADTRHGWVVLSYFFLGALFGLLVTTISTIFVVTSMVFGGGEIIGGAVLSALVGAVVLYTHLTQGLKRSEIRSRAETSAGGAAPAPPLPPPSAAAGAATSWPSAVYFRLAALIGLIVAVSGALGVCDALAAEIFGESPGGPGMVFDGGSIFGNPRENIMSGLLTTGVGLLVMWWHLTEARKRGH